MVKKKYEKPIAEYIAFYFDEEITANLPLSAYANDDDSMSGNAGASGSWSEGSGDGFID